MPLSFLASAPAPFPKATANEPICFRMEAFFSGGIKHGKSIRECLCIAVVLYQHLTVQIELFLKGFIDIRKVCITSLELYKD